MTDQQINIALAKAIGWTEKDIDRTYIFPSGKIFCNHCVFDYRDPAVIWPIAKHFGCFPSGLADGNGYAKSKRQNRTIHKGWEVLRYDYSTSKWGRTVADTPELAVAMAVIGGAA